MMKARLGRGLPNWNDYVRALHHHFGNSLYEDPIAELLELKQSGSVQEFLDQFDELLDQVELSEEYAISCFLKGLKPEIEVQVRMLSLRTLMKAYNLAKLAEHSLKLQMDQYQSVVRSSRALLPTTGPSWNSKKLQCHSKCRK